MATISINQALGFTGSFYSLWNVTDCSIHNETFDQTIIRYNRVRKVSKHLHLAQKKYPSLQVLPILDGKTHGFTDYGEKIYNSVDRFRFGKYNGEKIENHLDDMNYITWYVTNVYDEHKKYILDVLMKNGCEEIKTVVKNNGFKVTKREIITPKEITRRNEMNTLANNLNTTLNITHWLNENGEYRGENKNITYIFKDFKYCYYAGYEYYKPAINGVGKNVKGKDIKIKSYTTEVTNNGQLKVFVTDFEVIKK